ncbi:MAG TPA: hypothetical protein VKY73_10885, partial [Polyangiaceae bacterium]|nr:hypothetical protein [Polyangiaceae bacterium]
SDFRGRTRIASCNGREHLLVMRTAPSPFPCNSSLRAAGVAHLVQHEEPIVHEVRMLRRGMLRVVRARTLVSWVV